MMKTVMMMMEQSIQVQQKSVMVIQQQTVFGYDPNLTPANETDDDSDGYVEV